jgi:hypothetical protein
MGSFDKVCGISGMTIRGDEPCYVTGLEKQRFVYRNGANIFHVDQEWQPISFPQLTTYYDYGYIAEDFKPSPLNLLLGFDAGQAQNSDEKMEDEEEDGAKYRLADTFFLVHKTVHDTFSKEIIDPDIFGYRKEILEQGPEYFIKAFEDAKELAASREPEKPYKFSMFPLYLENTRAFGWKISKIGWKILHQVQEDQSFDFLDRAIESGLADALYRQFIFEQNMGTMWKHYRPSNYGGQQDNREIYEVLADTIKKVSAEKLEREAQWENE